MGATLLEKTVGEKYLYLPVESIEENDWNPNKMPPDEFALMQKHIDNTGTNEDQPIMVRVHPDKNGLYQIIDGAHRFRAMKELGFEEVIAIVKEMDTKEAMLKTVSMNKHRGEADTILLAKLFERLRTDYNITDEEIQEYLGYSDDELRGIDSIINYSIDDVEMDDELPDTPTEEGIPNTITLTVTQQQETILKKACKVLGASEDKMAEVLAKFATFGIIEIGAGSTTPLHIKSILDPIEGIENYSPSEEELTAVGEGTKDINEMF